MTPSSWLVIALLHHQLETQVQGMRPLVEMLQHKLSSDSLFDQLDLVQKLLLESRGMTGQKEERKTGRKERAMRHALGLVSAR